MMNNFLKVYDEDLVNGSLAAETVGSDKVLNAGSTMGALAVNVFAKGAVTLASDVVVTVKHGDDKDGSFGELMNVSVSAGGSFKDGELMATAILPENTKAYIMATVTSAVANSGDVRVTLGYLAR